MSNLIHILVGREMDRFSYMHFDLSATRQDTIALLDLDQSLLVDCEVFAV